MKGLLSFFFSISTLLFLFFAETSSQPPEITIVQPGPPPSPPLVPRPLPTEILTAPATADPTDPEATVQPITPPIPVPPVFPGRPAIVCDSDECCERLPEVRQRPIPLPRILKQETLRFNSRCLDGGLHCIVGTGCEICSNQTEIVTPPRPSPTPIPIPPPIPTQRPPAGEETLTRPQCEAILSCGTQECCQTLEAEASASLVLSQRCLLGGERCFEQSGCERCSDTPGEGLPPCDLTVQCTDQICCSARSVPNPQTGFGYYSYDENCLQPGNTFCVGDTGCRLCFNELEGVSADLIAANHLPRCPPLTADGDLIFTTQ